MKLHSSPVFVSLLFAIILSSWNHYSPSRCEAYVVTTTAATNDWAGNVRGSSRSINSSFVYTVSGGNNTLQAVPINTPGCALGTTTCNSIFNISSVQNDYIVSNTDSRVYYQYAAICSFSPSLKF